MCGFVAILGENSYRDKLILNKMLDKIQHRGPDGRSINLFSDQAIFGHVRLAVLDIKNGDQPMVSECGRYILVFNGEIYNYVELKDSLIKKGIKFKGTGDTEVLFNMLINEGKDCLKSLNGMFSFVFLDKKTKEWIAVRDHFGIKPLYFAELNQDKIIFASEIKSILVHPNYNANLKISALHDYLNFQLCLGNHTLFDGINKVLPAEVLEGNLNNISEIKKTKWWQLDYLIDDSKTEIDFLEELKHLLIESVTIQTRSDYPIGSYLSGGIDSSLITSITSKIFNGNLPSFHGCFENDKGFSELSFAEEVAQNNKNQLYKVNPTQEDFIKYLPKLIYYLDEPLAGPGVFPQYIVSRLASKTVKVVLGGQGGDELFGGYARYLIAYLEQALKGSIDGSNEEGNHLVTLNSIVPNLRLLDGYQPLMQKFFKSGLFENMNKRYFHLISRLDLEDNPFNKDLINSFNIDSQENRFNKIFNIESKSYINKMTAFDLNTLLPALLQVEDRVSMAWGLEARVPFLDYRIAELVSKIPPKIKFKGGNTKVLLKKISKGIIPNSIINRKDKMGFPVPLNNWMKSGPVKDYVSDILLSKRSLERGIFSKKYLTKLIDSSRGPASRDLWGAISLETWFTLMFDN